MTRPDPAPPRGTGTPHRRPDGWLLVAGARRTLHRFRDGWRALPRGSWAAWLRALLLGLAGCALLAWGMAKLGAALAPRGMQAWDAGLLRRIAAGLPRSFSNAIWAETPGNGVFLVPVVLLAASVCAWRGMPLRALTILAAFFLVDVMVLAGWQTWDRSRPTLILDGAAAPGFHSFPSGHLAQVVTSYGTFVYLWARATRSRAERAFAVLCLAALVAVVGLARLRLGAHWPSDVVAGTLVGLAWLAVTVAALRAGEARGGR